MPRRLIVNVIYIHAVPSLHPTHVRKAELEQRREQVETAVRAAKSTPASYSQAHTPTSTATTTLRRAELEQRREQVEAAVHAVSTHFNARRISGHTQSAPNPLPQGGAGAAEGGGGGGHACRQGHVQSTAMAAGACEGGKQRKGCGGRSRCQRLAALQHKL